MFEIITKRTLRSNSVEKKIKKQKKRKRSFFTRSLFIDI